MQKIFSTSPFDHDVEKATSEMNTSEDWETILQICDNVKEKPNGAKDCIRAISKRLNSHVPHQVMHALTLLDACVQNCDKKFLLALASRDFNSELKKLLKKGHPKAVEKLKTLLAKWSGEEVFKDSELSLIPALHNSIKNDTEKKETFIQHISDTATTRESPPKKPSNMTPTEQKEEEDLVKAIELSLKESSSHRNTQSKSLVSSLYPIASVNSAKEPLRQVKALYDFEAVEDNELSFKTGEVIVVLDDSDANWWRGTCNNREGLFPANFVSAENLMSEEEISEPPEPSKPLHKEKSVHFNNEVTVKKIVEINEQEIDKMLHLLHDADPTEELVAESNDELLALESTCFAMAELIDQELEIVDRHTASLNSSNQQLVDALHFYESLMKDYSAHGGSLPYSSYTPVPDVMRFPPVHTQIYGAHTHHTPLQTNYLPESYQQLTTPSNSERFQAPLAPSGAVPTSIPSCMIHSASHPHINYGRTNENFASIPQTTLTSMSSGNFSAPMPSRDQNIFYGDMAVTSMPPSSAPLPLPQQPMS